jgi:hypothetical protein
MVGRMVTHDGAPVVGQRVQTVEAETRTAEDGHFDLSYKQDAAYIHLVRDGVWYRRMINTADLGSVVDVVLPKTRSIAMECPVMACPLEFSWELEGGWYAMMGGQCEPRSMRVYAGAPVGKPEVLCRAPRGSTINPQLEVRETSVAWSVVEVKE